MDKKFTINGKEYVARDFDFNMLADFDEMGVDVSKVFTAPMSACRAYLALCGNISKEEAGIELQAHILNDGSLEEIALILADKVQASTFFQQTVAKKEATTKKSTKK